MQINLLKPTRAHTEMYRARTAKWKRNVNKNGKQQKRKKNRERESKTHEMKMDR